MEILNSNAITDRKSLPIKVMQFGGGNFLRAFVDISIQKINNATTFNAGVAVIKPTARGDYQELKSQDGLFSVQLEGYENNIFVQDLTVVDCIQKVINPYSEWQKYIDLSKTPELRFIISNTTEAGIVFNSDDTFDHTPPKEFPAKLTVWLFHRFTHFDGALDKGCILLPVELIDKNGEALKQCILQYADHWSLEESFKNWILEACIFYNTLVDRIVSGYPKDKIEEMEAKLGFKDQLAVAGELYQSWLLEGPDDILNEFPFNKTDLNIELVSDLESYRNLKVRILNGAHTSMVPVAYLLGERLVKDAMKNTLVANFIHQVLMSEVLETLDFPQDYKEQFANDVVNRFKNPALEHQLISIALNSTSKFVTRLLPSLKDYLKIKGSLPANITFALSALIRFYEGSFNNDKIDLNDTTSVLEYFSNTWEQFRENDIDLNTLTTRLLGNSDIWQEDLNQITGLTNMIYKNLSNIEKYGFEEALTMIN
ncbi:tagaturonate reductase [Maribacter sp. M208]|uniref:tagaturonate reductase n=1 Tax=Maribacter huludaoensis TaxID=3030010 RepID=UPI0023EBB1AE|nr:tagaturonate reductase [Maribacter huludaoensis]MDF4222556.1 tagaturonate reductase [Maribacter huludaoensis]